VDDVHPKPPKRYVLSVKRRVSGANYTLRRPAADELLSENPRPRADGASDSLTAR
jgi:hypothetical protein